MTAVARSSSASQAASVVFPAPPGPSIAMIRVSTPSGARASRAARSISCKTSILSTESYSSAPLRGSFRMLAQANLLADGRWFRQNRPHVDQRLVGQSAPAEAGGLLQELRLRDGRGTATAQASKPLPTGLGRVHHRRHA